MWGYAPQFGGGKDCVGVCCENTAPLPPGGDWPGATVIPAKKMPLDMKERHETGWSIEEFGGGILEHLLVFDFQAFLYSLLNPHLSLVSLPPNSESFGVWRDKSSWRGGFPHCWHTSSGMLISVPLQLPKFNCFSPFFSTLKFFSTVMICGVLRQHSGEHMCSMASIS